MSGCVSFHFFKLKHKKTQCVLHCAAFILHNYNFHKTLHALIFSRLFKKTNYIHLFSPQITSFMFAAFLNLPNAQKDSFSQYCESLICRWWQRSVFVFPLFWTLSVSDCKQTLLEFILPRSFWNQQQWGFIKMWLPLLCCSINIATDEWTVYMVAPLYSKAVTFRA